MTEEIASLCRHGSMACPDCDKSSHQPLYARPRPEEAHTVDVGHVHVRRAFADPDGTCAYNCPHPDHRTEETPDA